MTLTLDPSSDVAPDVIYIRRIGGMERWGLRDFVGPGRPRFSLQDGDAFRPLGGGFSFLLRIPAAMASAPASAMALTRKSWILTFFAMSWIVKDLSSE